MTTQQPRISTRPDGVLARGVLGTRASVLTLARRFPLLADAALAALILVLSLPPMTALQGSSHALSLALILAVVLPLIWRRRAPVAICVALTVLAAVQWFVSRELTDYLAILVAFYTAVVLAPLRLALAAGALLETTAVLAAANWPSVGLHAVWGWLIATGLIGVAGFGGYYVRTARRARAASLAERAMRLERDREQQAQLAVAAERARIARELHDIVAHNIAMMITLSDGAAATAANNPGRAVTLMGDISATGRAALTEMRRLLGVLRQPVSAGHSPQPGLADIDDLLAGVRTAGLPTRLTVTGEPADIPASAQLALYRMVQEALTNTLKHAPGARTQVSLTFRDGEVELEVADDGGPGSGIAASQPVGGHGIVGMRERAAVFGGEVSAGPRPGGGWRVHTVLSLGASGRLTREDGE